MIACKLCGFVALPKNTVLTVREPPDFATPNMQSEVPPTAFEDDKRWHCPACGLEHLQSGVALFSQRVGDRTPEESHFDSMVACMRTLTQLGPDRLPDVPANRREEWAEASDAELRKEGVGACTTGYNESEIKEPALRSESWAGVLLPRIVIAHGKAKRGWHAVLLDRYTGIELHDPHPARRALSMYIKVTYLVPYPKPPLQRPRPECKACGGRGAVYPPPGAFPPDTVATVCRACPACYEGGAEAGDEDHDANA